MFTGIIEKTGIIREITPSGSNKSFWLSSPLSNELKVDQSLSHNGICLTIEEIKEGMHKVTAIAETLSKTNLNYCKPGDLINLERCVILNGRLDGHIVQGHVDTVVQCTERISRNGSWEFTFGYDLKFAPLLIEKGSVCLNGISLTVFNLTDHQFTVGIIPYTFDHTNIKNIHINDHVNVEFDMIGKYVARLASLK